MANIRVDLGYTIKDGAEIKFRSPADCSAITGLIVYYQGTDGNTTSKEFMLADAHGNNVGDIDHLFAEDVVVKVILDVTKGMAFVQNADTNAYIERTFIKSVNGAKPDENGNVNVAGGGVGIYTATPDTLIDIIGSAENGATIQLTAGTYPLLTLTNEYGLTRKNLHGYIALAFNNGTKNDDGTLAEEAVITTYPENLTIRGGKDVYMEGVSLSSGALSHERTLTDLTLSTLPGGLTFENINFTKSACLRNAQIEGLSFIGCNVSGGHISIKASSYSDIHGGDHWQGATAVSRKPFMGVRAKNVIIKNCTIDAKGLSEPNTSAIYLNCVDGATVDANTITSADFNGVQVTGLEEKGLTAFASTGKITVSNNIIKNTSNRAIRIAHLENADLNVIMNSIASGIPYANDYIRITNCANTKTFFGKGGSNPADAGTLNLYDGARIDVGSGVTVSEDEFQDLIIARGSSELWTYRKWSSGLAELWYLGKSDCTYQYVALPFTLTEEMGCFAKQMMKNYSDGETMDVTVYSPYTDCTSLYTKKQINGVVYNAAYLDTPVYIVGRWK